MRLRFSLTICFTLSWILWAQMPDLSGSFTFPLEGNAIGYAAPAKRDPIAVLQRKIDNGEVKLAFDDKHGYLQAVLDALHVPVETQMLVYF